MSVPSDTQFGDVLEVCWEGSKSCQAQGWAGLPPGSGRWGLQESMHAGTG